ncbi:MAG: DUF6677 family protein [Candidatus Sumerlaeia bacterium]|nr:DUF6677 family protein [Candidatus Sumerlaeia bacterium]
MSDPATPAPGPVPRVARPVALAWCALNWIVPGLGYFAAGDRFRGAALFLLINGVLVAGYALGGHFLPPVWRVGAPNFSIVSCLTYILQLFHGGAWALSAFSMGIVERGSQAAAAGFFAGRPGMPYADLGAFHLLAAGAMNYLSTVRLYDEAAGDPSLVDDSAEASA